LDDFDSETGVKIIDSHYIMGNLLGRNELRGSVCFCLALCSHLEAAFHQIVASTPLSAIAALRCVYPFTPPFMVFIPAEAHYELIRPAIVGPISPDSRHYLG